MNDVDCSAIDQQTLFWMKVDSETACDLLIGSSQLLPLAYAAWKSQGDLVFVSDKLKCLISARSNFVDPYEFVVLTKKLFGSFLNIAVEKVSGEEPDKCSYSSTLNLLGENFFLRLILDMGRQTYVFTAEVVAKIRGNGPNLDLEKLLNDLPVCIWQRDKNLRITYCNRAYADVVDITQDSIISNNARSQALFPGMGSMQLNQSLHSSSADKSFEEHIIVNGSRRLFRILEKQYADGESFSGVAFDITDQEKLRKEYSNYKNQTEETLDNISIPIAIFDQNAVLVFANTAIIKLFAMSDVDLYGRRKFADLVDRFIDDGLIIPVTDVDEYKSAVSSIFTTIVEPYHASVTLKNWKTMNVTISPNQGGGLIFMFEDVSDKVALERELNSMASVQIGILDHLMDGIMIFGIDNKIKIANNVINAMWGREKKSAVTGVHINDFFESVSGMFGQQTDAKSWLSKLISIAAQKTNFSDLITLSSGKVLRYSYIPLPEGLNLIKFTDITECAHLRQLLDEKTEQLSTIDKLKRNVIANISHRLMAPLSTISGFMEILQNQYFGVLNKKQLEYCYEISKSAEELADAVDAIIYSAEIEAGQVKLKFVEVRLLDFINKIIDQFSVKAGSYGIELGTTFADAEFRMVIDEHSMRRAISQLVSRFIKMTPSDGEIVLAVEFDKSKPGTVDLLLCNTGISPSDGDLEYLQKILRNSDEDRSDTDLRMDFGITLANSVIKLHHGTMSVERDDNKRLIVKSRIPLQQFLQ
ncbi:MAG: PAS domain-containing sensor histidine kinase [Holosporales bacterium]|jgi:signal transduction histidine kinase|nr:PAS domain-containing sensor histidine kinase [Holosporales bacterium]